MIYSKRIAGVDSVITSGPDGWSWVGWMLESSASWLVMRTVSTLTVVTRFRRSMTCSLWSAKR